MQPWNYPYYQLARFAAPHLASGNVMLVKHAPDVPQCALAFERILREAALPEGAYTNVFVSNEEADTLIEDPRIRGVALTGSERTGSTLASIAALAQLKPGDPFDEQTTLGPLCSEGALERLLSQVKEAVSHGAHVYTGGDRIDWPGAFMQPTILTNVTPHNPAYSQEFFGPVALFFKAKNEEEAVAIANDSPYGLGGSIYTKDIEHGKRLASKIDTGMVFINYPSVSAPDLPFGGIKHSGYGADYPAREGESGGSVVHASCRVSPFHNGCSLTM